MMKTLTNPVKSFIEKEICEKIFSISEYDRKQILLGHTARNFDDYKTSILIRHNKKYTTIPHYVIKKNGEIVNLVPTKYVTKLFGHHEIDSSSISIFLENLGWLSPTKNKVQLTDWLGNIYNGETINKKWRGKILWEPYSDVQINSTMELINELCDNNNINKNFIGHNVKVSGIEHFEGITTRSNYSMYFTDLSPAFDYEKFKKL